MQKSNFQLILTEVSGNFAIPDIEITTDTETVFNIQDAADISKRKDTVSKSISFPGTKNNNRIFNNLFSLNRDADSANEETLYFNYSPAIGVRAVLYENNYPIVSGLLKINNIKKDKPTGAFTYTGVITGNLVNFFGKLGDKLIEDLPLFDQDVIYSWGVITNSWDYGENQLVVFPSIDYGKGIYPTITKMDYRNFRPAIYLRWYLLRLFKHYGYTISSTLLKSDILKKIIIPFAEQDFGKTVFGNVAVSQGIAPYTLPIMRGVQAAYESFKYELLDDDTYISIVKGLPVYGNAINNEHHDYDPTKLADVFTITRLSNVGAVVKYNFDIKSSAFSTTFWIQIIGLGGDDHFDSKTSSSDSRIYAEKTWNVQDYGLAFGRNYQGTLNLPFETYQAGTRFFVMITTTSTGGKVDYTQNDDNSVTFTNTDISTGSFFQYNFGDTFNLNTVTPRGIKIIDFLKSIMNTLNLYLIENPDDDQQLIIETYDAFYSKMVAPAQYALDWTKKIDNSSLEMDINTSLPKTYNFNFKEDSDFYNALYKNTWSTGYGNLSIDNLIGTADAQKIEPIFSATPIVTEDKDDKTLPAIWKGEITKKTSFKSNLRLLYNNGTSGCRPYDVGLTAGSYDDQVFTSIIENVTNYNTTHHVLKVDGINSFNLVFGLPKSVYYKVDADVFNIPNLYNLYENLVLELNNINIYTLKVDAHLRDYDISGLDLARPIFISTTQGMAYFKIMGVTYFNSDEVANLVLQKIVYRDAVNAPVIPPPVDPPVTPPVDPTTSTLILSNTSDGILNAFIQQEPGGTPTEYHVPANTTQTYTISIGNYSIQVSIYKPGDIRNEEFIINGSAPVIRSIGTTYNTGKGSPLEIIASLTNESVSG